MLPIITLALLACTASGAQQQLLGQTVNLGQSSGSQIYSLGSGQSLPGSQIYSLGSGQSSSGSQIYSLGSGQSSSGSQIYSLGSGQSSSGSGLFSIGSDLSASGSIGQAPVTSQIYTSSAPATSQIYTLNAGGSSLGGLASGGQSYALNSGSSSGGQSILLGQAPQQAISYTSSAAVAPAFSVVQSNPGVAVGQVSAITAPVQQVFTEQAQVQPGQEIIYRVRTPPKVQKHAALVAQVVQQPKYIVSQPKYQVVRQVEQAPVLEHTTVVKEQAPHVTNIQPAIHKENIVVDTETGKPQVFLSQRRRKSYARKVDIDQHKITHQSGGGEVTLQDIKRLLDSGRFDGQNKPQQITVSVNGVPVTVAGNAQADQAAQINAAVSQSGANNNNNGPAVQVSDTGVVPVDNQASYQISAPALSTLSQGGQVSAIEVSNVQALPALSTAGQSGYVSNNAGNTAQAISIELPASQSSYASNAGQLVGAGSLSIAPQAVSEVSYSQPAVVSSGNLGYSKNYQLTGLSSDKVETSSKN